MKKYQVGLVGGDSIVIDAMAASRSSDNTLDFMDEDGETLCLISGSRWVSCVLLDRLLQVKLPSPAAL